MGTKFFELTKVLGICVTKFTSIFKHKYGYRHGWLILLVILFVVIG